MIKIVSLTIVMIVKALFFEFFLNYYLTKFRKNGISLSIHYIINLNFLL